MNQVFDIPIDDMLRAVQARGQSLVASGLFSLALLSILESGRPLPSDERRAAKMVRMDIRAYRRALDECLDSRCLTRLPSGEIWAPLANDCRASRERKERFARGHLGASTRAAVLAKTNGLCAYCAVVLTTDSGQPTSFEPDHVLPVTRGGSDDIANLIPACHGCNQKKRAKTALVFLGVGE